MISKSVEARSRTRSFATGIGYITEHAHERACVQAERSFEDGIGYASAPKKAAWVQLRGVTSVETAAIEMEAVAALSRRCKDPVYHLIVAYAKGERPTREQVVSDAERLLKAIGMERNQYVLAAHQTLWKGGPGRRRRRGAVGPCSVRSSTASPPDVQQSRPAPLAKA